MMDISIIIIDLTPGHYGLSRGQGHFNPVKMQLQSQEDTYRVWWKGGNVFISVGL